MRTRAFHAVLSLIVVAFVSACGSSGDDSGNSNVLGLPGATTGRINIDITDAPVDSAHKVCIAFSDAEFKLADSDDANQVIEFDPPVAIDVLALQGTDSAPLIINQELTAGQYDWIRLGVIEGRDLPLIQDADPLGTECVTEGSYIVLEDGMLHNLYVPGGDQRGLQLNRGFFIPSGGSASFTIDFDLRKSVGAPRGQAPDYRLRPTLRLSDNNTDGTLSGTVDTSLATAPDCMPVVYVYNGDVTPDDMDGDDGDPLTSATVESADGGVTWSYTVGFLPPGDYTAAFTCDADDAELDEELTFVPPEGADFTVEAGGDAVVNF